MEPPVPRFEVVTTDVQLPDADDIAPENIAPENIAPDDIPRGGSPGLTGVLALPVGDGPWPAVVMVHEAFGVTAVMRRQVARLASAGYAVLMPDLFVDGGARKCLRSTFRALMSGEGRAFVDIERARRWMLDRSDTTSGIGVIGFCMGGGFALMTASRGFDAASVNYGRLPKELDPALDGACPVVASFGGADRSLRGASSRLETALIARRIPHDVVEYPGAGHAFMNDEGLGPRMLQPLFERVLGVGPAPDAAADSWRRIESFFDRHLAPAGR